MARNLDKIKHVDLIKEYLGKYSEDLSANKIAKKILKENSGINYTQDTLRVYITDVRSALNYNDSVGVAEACEEHGVNPNDVPYLWLKSKDASLHVKNPLYKQKEYNQFKEDILESLKEHSPVYPVIKRNKSEDSHLLVVDVADLHIGKLCDSFETGEDYDSQIAVRRAKEGVQGILDKSFGFNVDTIIFVGGNDILHVDTPKNTTTAGTHQDTSQMWYRNFLDAKKLYVELLQMLITIADVHFMYNPSNHDYTNGFFLADVIQTHFRSCQNITFDCSLAHRKYFTYGLNLIGTSHGDGAKQQDLPLIMANESKDWSNTKHRYVYTHHVHHKSSKDYHGVTVESLRSPSGVDSWHHKKGFGVGGIKAVEGFIHHPIHGQIARFTHIF